MNTPTISVIVPVFNVEKYIRKCLDSLLAQTYTDFEVILVDDGSSDHGGKICDEYGLKDERIKVIHTLNSGPSAARNCGLDVARSSWITFADADDSVRPTYLENFLKYISDDIYTQIVQGYYCIGYEGNETDTLYPDTKYEYTEMRENTYCDYVEKNNILCNCGVWCKLFSGEIIRKFNLRFEESIWCFEDAVFWHRYLCYIKKVIFIPEMGYDYFCPRAQYNSVSRQPRQSIEYDTALAANYMVLSSILPDKFKLGIKGTAFLQMVYLNSYFRAILKSKNLSSEELTRLRMMRPSKKFMVHTGKGLIYWVLNLFPIKLIRFLFSPLRK